MELIEVSSPIEDDPMWALAKSLSSKSPMKFKLGCVIVKKGKLIGFGYNQAKTHPQFGSKGDYKTLHSEGDALYCAKKLGNDTRGAIMIVYRKNWLNSKPCPSCQKLIEKAGISTVYYTNNEQRSFRQVKGK
jgi:deoxycytidylate deaminase